jgi:hypothetical protein
MYEANMLRRHRMVCASTQRESKRSAPLQPRDGQSGTATIWLHSHPATNRMAIKERYKPKCLPGGVRSEVAQM